jgi:hypothetical protein
MTPPIGGAIQHVYVGGGGAREWDYIWKQGYTWKKYLVEATGDQATE